MGLTSDQAGALHLVFGGANSGKSRHAERMAERLSPRRLYIATALGGQPELDARIATHRARRRSNWDTFEMGDGAVPDFSAHSDCAVLFDCATLWLALRMNDWRAQAKGLLDALQASGLPVVIVSNELGMGLVPTDAATREYRAAHGELNQMIADVAHSVTFVAAGQPLTLKGSAP